MADKPMTVDEIETFLNDDDDTLEQIDDCETLDEAEGVATDAMDEAGKVYDKHDLLAAVKKVWQG
jgi:hypothetical protein